jgi:glycosyltransferase involved in cell wall biosynthesis
MQVELFVGKYDRMMGLAWYSAALQKYYSKLGVDYRLIQPNLPLPIRSVHSLAKPFGYDIEAFFTLFPISAKFQKNTVKHFTTQQMASLLTFRRDLHPVIITVHDIIPYLVRDDPEQNEYHRYVDRWMDGLAINHLKFADCIITVSEYTRKMLIERLGIDAQKIRVILHGLDLDLFKPIPITNQFQDKYRINPHYQYILYVGSEIPRKNLPRLLEAFTFVKQKNPTARLIKIGTPVSSQWNSEVSEQIRRLGLQDEVTLFDHVSRDDLISFYNLADAFVFPSLNEGFGIPPLEAMACGAPVICSNSSSLPEVVGDAAICIDPLNVTELADAIIKVLEDGTLRDDMRKKGLSRASQFSWEQMACQTLGVYQEFSN